MGSFQLPVVPGPTGPYCEAATAATAGTSTTSLRFPGRSFGTPEREATVGRDLPGNHEHCCPTAETRWATTRTGTQSAWRLAVRVAAQAPTARPCMRP